MSRVLIVDSLAEFIAGETIPPKLSVTTFAERDGCPSGAFDVLVPVVTTRVTGADMDRLQGLHTIANYGVGYDNIDVAAAHARGIAISNTPGVLTDATAELTWALILAAARRIGEGERMVRAHAWPGWAPTQLRGLGLNGRTLGIVGAGRIGRAVGDRARAFGMAVRYWSRSRQLEWEAASGAAFTELETLLASCDVVTVHLSKAAGTEGLIDARALALLKDGAVFVNTARGAIVDQDALIRELQSGRISAGLDVYPNEPAVADELMELENVVLLPHIGSATYDSRQAMWNLAWANVLCALAGRPLVNPV